jgi:hypothetical protein
MDYIRETMQFSALFNEFEFSFLEDAAKLIDSRLNSLEHEASVSDDPDSLGIFDKAEYIIGFGLVACQTYITASSSQLRLSKKETLKFGSQHLCGYSIVCVVNAIANYWKHNSEWEYPLSKQAQETINIISSLQIDINASYVATNALSVLLRPSEPRIERILPFLKQWYRLSKTNNSDDTQITKL